MSIFLFMDAKMTQFNSLIVDEINVLMVSGLYCFAV